MTTIALYGAHVFSLVALAAPADTSGAEAAWRTGAEFRQRLDARVGVKWVDNPLRQGLDNLSRSQGVAVFLDRRVDPSAKITFTAEDQPLRSAFEGIAATLDMGVSVVDCVVYIGPKATASKLATLSMMRKDEARRLPSSTLKRLAERKSLAWEMLATPRELVEGVVRETGAKAPDTAFFPHDLWPAGDWPPLSAIDRLTLLLAGFEMTFETIAGEKGELLIRLVKMPETALAAREYRTSGGAANAAERLAKLYPAAQFRVVKGKLEVQAVAEDHEQIERVLRGESARPRSAPASAAAPPPGAEKRYTLKTPKQPFQSLAKALAKQLDLEIAFDAAVESKLAELTAIEVREATLAELLSALTAPLGLRYELNGKSLRIVAQ